MLSNFFGVLKTFKTSSFINILGLSVALIVFFIVLIQTHYDFTYDKGYAQSDEIFQFNIFFGDEGGVAKNINFQIPARIKEKIPEVKNFCIVMFWGENSFDVDKGDGTIPDTHQIPQLATTSAFNVVFAPEIVSGDTVGIFSAPGKALISEKTAQRLFGEEDPIGKTIRFHFWSGLFTVQAVYKDFPDNSTLENGIYSYLGESDQSQWNFSAFFQIDPNTIKTVNEKINTPEILGDEFEQIKEAYPEYNPSYRLTSMNELYLTGGGKGGGKRINTTISLLAIGILTLAIAFVNFVNLSLAMAPSRVRSLNIRRILGIDKMTLQMTIAMESVLFTLLAIGIAFFGMYVIKGTTLAQEMFTSNLSLSAHAGLLITASLVILAIAFLIGVYTMRYTTSFDESEALKGSFALGVQGVKLRNVLIVLQFTTAIALICISTFIQRQNDYMMSYDWGIPKENILYFPLSGLGESAQSFGQELLRDPRVKDYSISRDLPGRIAMSWGQEFEGKQISLVAWVVDDRFFNFFDVDIIAGSKPDHTDSIVSQVVVNEAFLKKYEFDETIVGKDFEAFGPGRIQAIAKDVNFQSLHDPIAPMALVVLSQGQNVSQFFLVKLTGNDMPGTLKLVEQTWNKFSKEPFDPHFLDESLNKLYQQENNMAKMIGIFGLIIVIISVMGVYGLIVFNARYKQKEIAIRKVNGSTEKEIILMLNRTVLIQLAIAFVIAIPIAYFAVNRWLENFAYKISMNWLIFLLGGLIVLIITLLTVSFQSYRAATANPTETLNKN